MYASTNMSPKILIEFLWIIFHFSFKKNIVRFLWENISDICSQIYFLWIKFFWNISTQIVLDFRWIFFHKYFLLLTRCQQIVLDFLSIFLFHSTCTATTSGRRELLFWHQRGRASTIFYILYSDTRQPCIFRISPFRLQLHHQLKDLKHLQTTNNQLQIFQGRFYTVTFLVRFPDPSQSRNLTSTFPTVYIFRICDHD